MRKFSIGLFLSMIALAGAAQERTLLQKTADTVCSCMDREITKIDTSDVQAMKDMFMTCFTTSAMSNLLQLAEERGVDITDARAGEMLGAEIAKELLKRNCQPFLTMSLATARKNVAQRERSVQSVQEVRGTLIRVENKDFRYLIVKDNTGREHSFIWLDYFEGSDAFVGDKAKTFIGKKLKVEWMEKEVYLPSAANYFKIKQVTGITVN